MVVVHVCKDHVNCLEGVSRDHPVWGAESPCQP
jgi:hypothetical protein